MVLRTEHREYLEAGLDILTDRERTALLLRDVEDLPAEEVAARLNCSKATVRSHIANARVKLRKHFARLQKRGSGMTHPLQTDLALYSSGDLPLWRRPMVRLHVAGCDALPELGGGFRGDRESVRAAGGGNAGRA